MADPILDRIVKQLAEARAAFPSDFAQLKPAELEQIIRAKSQGKYGLADLTQLDARNVGRSIAQGLSMNWGDELMGLVKGEGAKNEMRLRQDLFHQAHPAADIATQVVSGAAPALLAPEVKGASLLGTMLRSAGIGAGMGAAAGAGQAEDGRKLGGAVVGGALGAGVGAAVPGIVGGFRAAVSDPHAAAVARIASAIRKSGGTDVVRGAAQDMARNGAGADVMLADLSPFLRNQADFAATNSEDVFVPLAERLAQRQAGQSDRLLQGARDLIEPKLPGAATTPAADQQAALEETRRFAAMKNYDALRESGARFNTDPLASALKKPAVIDAWKRARLAGDLTHDDPVDQFLQRLTRANPGVDEKTLRKTAESMGVEIKAPPMREVSFADLQAFKQELDDRVSGAFARGKGNLAQAYKDIRNTVVQVMEQGAPGYKAANADYARRLGLENALEAGTKAWNVNDSRQLASQFSKLSGEEQDQFRRGMAAEMTAKLRNAATNRDEASRLVKAGPSVEDKLKLIFGDEPTFDQFMARAKAESEMHKTFGAVGNSATARRLSEAGVSPEELAGEVAAGAIHGSPTTGVLRGAAKATKGAIVRRTAKEMGPMLLTQGHPAIDQLLQTIRGTNPLLSALTTRVTPNLFTRGLLEDQQP